MMQLVLVSDAIKDLIKTFPIMLSKVEVCELGVSGVLVFEDAAGGVSGRRIEGGSAVREESPSRTLVIRYLGSILIFFELNLV